MVGLSLGPGNRGCICPKGKNLPSGTFSGAKPATSSTKLPQIGAAKTRKAHAKPATNPSKKQSCQPRSVHNDNEQLKTTPPPPESGVSLAEPRSPPLAALEPPVTETSKQQVGKVLVRYNHYTKEFAISGGSTTAQAIDGQYFLSGVFPNSILHLSRFSPSDFSFEAQGLTDRPMVHEAPLGVYQDLEVGATYWIHIEEDAAERAAYEKRQAEFAAGKAKDRVEKEERQRMTLVREKVESCSCVEGNPCVDKYCCKDWDHRHAVATKHGWKGFQ
ncbi:hypothetical protein DYB37_005173 [Aphanomyces astaci]|uniref:Uncharacterized protein n=1 Tax=Aphanomyces astaci TaxID=112090 RepID=A0A397BWN5_APHAT|nr:hypothetical protein DYB25_005385 [Aphanomyces astaci]RHY63257.1 hypothetical protein DYB38_002761 [Aphanomyces astaci]RHY75497.1 hypothetical protein DYB30_004043 [Aphanomyces astaci]RHZ22242.1 hypothetical protein DYB37_005173 [Aphanomyces astaci]